MLGASCSDSDPLQQTQQLILWAGVFQCCVWVPPNCSSFSRLRARPLGKRYSEETFGSNGAAAGSQEPEPGQELGDRK